VEQYRIGDELERSNVRLGKAKEINGMHGFEFFSVGSVNQLTDKDR
jgi:hypothetical protein